MQEQRIRTSRRLGAFALALGAGGAALAAAGLLDNPLFLLVVAALVLSGLLLLLDRRVRLALSARGVRYARWGPATVPWEEFSGYRWQSWRGQPHLQLLPRRPSELVAAMSAYGRLNHLCYQLARMPPFSIAVTQLDVADAELERLVARHLPHQPHG